MVHPKGHIMARTEDLFFRSAVVREGAMVGDSQALEVGAEIPEQMQEQVPDVPCGFAGLHHPQGRVNGSCLQGKRSLQQSCCCSSFAL